MGLASTRPWSTQPVPGWGVPAILYVTVRSGVWGLLFGVVYHSIPGRAAWLKGIVFSLSILVVYAMIGVPLFKFYSGAATHFVPFGLWSSPFFPKMLFWAITNSILFGLGLGLVFHLLLQLTDRQRRILEPSAAFLMTTAPIARWLAIVVVLTLYAAFGVSMIMRVMTLPPDWPAYFDVVNAAVIVPFIVVAHAALAGISTGGRELYAQAALEAGQPFCLYLRSFKIDRSEMFVQAARIWRVVKANIIPFYSIYVALFAKAPPGEDLQRLVEGSSPGLPVLAVGDKVTRHGVAKIITSDSEWEQVAGDLMNKAAAIIYSAYPTAGAIKELHIVADRYLRKTVFVMPSAAAYFGTNLGESWNRLRADLSPGFELPEYRAEGGIFSLVPSPDGTFRCGPLAALSASTLRTAMSNVASVATRVS